MKKLIASLMAIGMMCAISLPAVAAETTITQDSPSKKANVNFKYTKTAKYTVTIPEEVTIPTKDQATSFDINVISGETDIGLRQLIVTVPKSTDVKNSSSETVGTLTLNASKADSTVSSSTNLVAKINRDQFTEGFGFTATLAENQQMDVGDYTTPVEFTISLSDPAK